MSTGFGSMGGARTVSYKEAQRAAAVRAIGEGGGDSTMPREEERAPVDSRYTCGNNNSDSFFRRMRESHEEAERLRQQCRAAAGASPARGHEERVNLDFVTRSIEAAKVCSTFSATAPKATREAPTEFSATQDRGLALTGTFAADDGEGVPFWLGHLTVPKEVMQETPPCGMEMLLPGAIDTFEDTTVRSGNERDLDEAPDPPGSAQAGRSPVNQSNSSQGTASGHSQAPEDAAAAASGGAVAAPCSAPPPATASPIPRAEAQRGASPAGSEGGGGEGEVTGMPGEAEDRAASFEASSGNNSSSRDSSGSTGDDVSEEESEDRWPPSPPVLRFKMLCQFSSRFKPPADKALFMEMNKDLDERIDEGGQQELKDPTLGWLNLVFAMNIENTTQFEVGFPIIILTMLDAIYPKRVRWREVDWRFQYKRALQKNFSVLEAIWAEVNMEKAREFRVENTTLRLENLPTASPAEKLEFVRLMKRWFDQRIHHSGPYDPMAKRREFVDQCRAWGHTVKFPPWIKFEKTQVDRPKVTAYDKMPEFKRLIWFLGSPEHQTM